MVEGSGKNPTRPGDKPGKSLAVVLKRTDFRESSRIVELCTRDHGRLSFLAKGAHRPKSPFLGAIDLFHIVEARLRVRSGSGLQRLYGLRVLQDNRPFRRDPLRLRLAYHFSGWIRLSMPEGQPAPEIFDLLLGGLRLFGRAPRARLGTILVALEFRLLDRLGFLPRLSRCVRTGAPLPRHGGVAFDPALGGFALPDRGRDERIPAAVPWEAERLLTASGRELPSSRVGEALLPPLRRAAGALLRRHLCGEPKVEAPWSLLELGGRHARIPT